MTTSVFLPGLRPAGPLDFARPIKVAKVKTTKVHAFNLEFMGPLQHLLSGRVQARESRCEASVLFSPQHCDLHTGPAALLPVETTTVFVSCRWRASASTSASSSCSPATAAPLNWHTWASYASLTCCAGVCVCARALLLFSDDTVTSISY